MNIQNITSELRLTIGALHKQLRRQTGANERFSLTELETIGRLASGPLLASQLAQLARVRAQSMTQILRKLDAMDMIRRKPSRDDGRKVFIQLSPHGKRVVRKTLVEKDRALHNALASLSHQELRTLSGALPILKKLIRH